MARPDVDAEGALKGCRPVQPNQLANLNVPNTANLNVPQMAITLAEPDAISEADP